MLIKLALRNLMLHRVKTLIIASLVVLGVFLSFVGTSLVDDISDNLKNSFVNYYTGDLVIRNEEQLSGIFGASGEGGESSGVPVVKPIRHYQELVDYLQTQPEVSAVTKIYVGYGMPNVGEMVADFLLLWGIQPEDYFRFFPNLVLVEGRFLQEGERGIMLHSRVRKNLEENYRNNLGPGANLQINNLGVTGIKIRTVPIVGIFEYPMANDRFFVPNLLDIETARLLYDRPAGGLGVTLKEDQTNLLGDVSEEDLFGEEIIQQAQTAQIPNPEDLRLVQESAPEPARGSWTHVLLRLSGTANPADVENELSEEFERRNWKLQVQDWFFSAQPDSAMALGLRALLSVVVFLISVVSVVVMMNTLIASIMERTSEVGTMRALGARRSFISKMLLVETFVLVIVSGILAIALGSLVLGIINLIGLRFADPALWALFGGEVFRPRITWNALFGALILMSQIAFFSWLFPVLSAVKISPLKAMSTE